MEELNKNKERNAKVGEKIKGGVTGDVAKIALLNDISVSLAAIADSLAQLTFTELCNTLPMREMVPNSEL